LIIKNYENIIRNGLCDKCKEARRKILKILEVAVKAADPEEAIRRNISRRNMT